jgi:hypothetical protein
MPNEDEKAMYLILCGWEYVVSNIDNPHWRGERAWFYPEGALGYVTTNQAYEMERYKDAE